MTGKAPPLAGDAVRMPHPLVGGHWSCCLPALFACLHLLLASDDCDARREGSAAQEAGGGRRVDQARSGSEGALHC